MRIDNDTIAMNTNRQSSEAINIASKSPAAVRTNKIAKDKVDLSISGRLRGINSTVPIRKVKTAGLIITDLKISRPNGEDFPRSFEVFTATVSNERAVLNTSENRLGGNTRSIDNPPDSLGLTRPTIRDLDMAEEIMGNTKENIIKNAPRAILAQGNSRYDTVFELLK